MNKHIIWSLELCELYDQKNIDKLREKLFEITDVFIYLHDILAENKVQLLEKDIYSEQLVIKFHLQNLSLIELSKGHSIKSKFRENKSPETKFLDISSIITIVRSQYESLLMYQHLYVNSSSEDQQKLRFDGWIMSSMISRSKVFEDAQKRVPERYLREQKSINELRERIKNNTEYDFLTEKQKNNIIENGSGKLFKSWDKLFDESKFSKDGVFSKIYYIASAYAHSEGLLALQLKETKHLMEHEHMKESSNLMLFYSYLMTNIMIKNIVNKFPLVKERFDSLDEKIQFEVNLNYDMSFK